MQPFLYVITVFVSNMPLKLIVTLLISIEVALASDDTRKSLFIRQFIAHQARPATVVSFMHLNMYENLKLCKDLSESSINYDMKKESRYRVRMGTKEHHLFVADLQDNNILNVLMQAEKQKLLLIQARWLLFYNTDVGDNIRNNLISSDNDANFGDSRYFEDEKVEVENLLTAVNIGINTEVYVVFVDDNKYHVFLAYKRRRHLPMLWEVYSTWNLRFDRPPPTASVAMRRRNLQGLDVVTTSVIHNNQSFDFMPDYLHREVDSLTKVIYYMVTHLFEWMNASGHVNTSASWGYLQPDGSFDGIVREMHDGRSDFSGSVLIQMKNRLTVVDYVLPPGPLNLLFIFRKPSLASVANIYYLPFSLGVWLATGALILVSSAALFVASFSEVPLDRSDMTVPQRISTGLLNTLCMVFQQGTANDPVSVSYRQIVLLGLMAFMFLYTAYSANVVALLQSAANDITSVETLLASPLQCGAEDVVYNREIFNKETRPVHRALWLKKGVPQGDKFFLPVEEGIKRLRMGMYAFHVEPTAGYDQIKKTFLEHEKCNLGTVKYTDFLYPYVGLSRHSHIREALKIGVIRMIESGVQSRSTRRILSAPPSCGAGTAMFTAVRLMDVAPAVKSLAALYTVAGCVFALEIAVARREKKKRLTQDQNEDEAIDAGNIIENNHITVFQADD